jgi:hypothetical protein
MSLPPLAAQRKVRVHLPLSACPGMLQLISQPTASPACFTSQNLKPFHENVVSNNKPTPPRDGLADGSAAAWLSLSRAPTGRSTTTLLELDAPEELELELELELLES